jgi:NhaA family Na+:H+ antiporter
MVVPAAFYVAIAALGDASLRGWAIPTATDIAFALAILAVISTHLPVALRTFLLTLAVVDDLLAITVIAVFYTESLDLAFLALAALPLVAFGVLVQRRVFSPLLLLPLAAATWTLVHESGVHATVAGVLLAFTLPVRAQDGEEGPGPAEAVEHRLRPVSAAIAVPVFAFFASGVALGGFDGVREALSDPVALGVVAGLVVGKTLGVAGSTWLLHTFTHADLDDDLSWVDVIGLSMLAGVGFTVSLLIGELAFERSAEHDHVVVAVLVGSMLAGLMAAVVLRGRNRAYRRICEAEERDDDHDGIPDIYLAGEG